MDQKTLGGIVGSFRINFPSLWQGIKWIWDWFGRLDLVASHLPHFKKMGDMIGFIFNPPPWMIFPSVIIGGTHNLVGCSKGSSTIQTTGVQG